MPHQAIGLIETRGLVALVEGTDAMLKAGNIRLLLSRSICSGKYMVLIGGDTAAVEAAIEAGAWPIPLHGDVRGFSVGEHGDALRAGEEQ